MISRTNPWENIRVGGLQLLKSHVQHEIAISVSTVTSLYVYLPDLNPTDFPGTHYHHHHSQDQSIQTKFATQFQKTLFPLIFGNPNDIVLSRSDPGSITPFDIPLRDFLETCWPNWFIHCTNLYSTVNGFIPMKEVRAKTA